MIIIKGQLTQQLVITTLQELGIQNPDEENYICELTQDCRHVFTIPLFPIRTYWVVKNAKGKEVTNGDVFKRLKSVEKQFRFEKNVSWTGLVVLIFILFLPPAALYYSEWRMEHKNEKERQGIYETTIDLLKSPSLTNYYNFEMERSDNKEIEYYTYKINKVKKDSVQFVLLYDHVVPGGYDGYSKETLTEMTIKNNVFNSFWVKKESLMQLFLNSSATPKRSSPIYVMDDNHNKITLLGLNHITVVSGPLFNPIKNDPDRTNYMIVNEGFDTKIDSIEVEIEDGQWSIPTGVIIHHADSFPISVTGQGKAYLYCSDSFGVYKIDLYRDIHFLYINRKPGGDN